MVHGSPETVGRQLLDIQGRYQVDEIIVVTAIGDFPQRLRSYQLLSRVMLEPDQPRRSGPENVDAGAT